MHQQYMVEIALPAIFTAEFASLIPAQRARINHLLIQGDIRSYTLSLDRSRLWVVMSGRDEEHIEAILDTFPIMEHCVATIHELMFHDMATHEAPRISLN